MASKAPLVLAAVLFAFGLVGLAQTVRQTSDPIHDPSGRLIVGRRAAVAPQPTAPEAVLSQTADEPLPVATETPVLNDGAPAGTTTSAPAEAAAPAPTPEPPLGSAIAAAIASDGPEAVGNATALTPLIIGAIARDADDELSDGDTPSAEAPVSTPTPEAAASD